MTQPHGHRADLPFKILRAFSVVPDTSIFDMSINQPNRSQSYPVMGRGLGSQVAAYRDGKPLVLGRVPNFQ
jgi:hypothetical protein